MTGHLTLLALRVSAVSTGLAFVIALGLVTSQDLLAQAGQPNRILHATVTDRLNRYVTGLTQDHFHVFENGSRRPVASVLSPDDPIFVAVVNQRETVDLGAISGPVEVFETRSLSDAIQRLAASKTTRKALILAVPTDTKTIPGDVFAIVTDTNNLRKAVIEVCNQYAIGFESTDFSAASEVVVKQPVGLPLLKANIRK